MIYIPSRVKRHKCKFDITTGPNLVSLIDIFTTLVFFLLIHVSGEEEAIPPPGIVDLPLSISTQRPIPAPTVYITTNEILVENKKIAEVREVLKVSDASIAALEKELLNQTKNVKGGTEFNKRVIIMGDKSIPFALLKKVIYTCSKAGYPEIALAVIEKGL